MNEKRGRRVKMFEGNYDGSRMGLILATSQKMAANIAGCGVQSFRDFWYSLEPRPYCVGKKHDTLYTKPMDAAPSEYVEGRCALPPRGARAPSGQQLSDDTKGQREKI